MHNTIVTVEELKQNINNPNWVVFDCRFAVGQPDLGKEKYLENHIPHARYVDLDNDASSPETQTSGRHPLPDPHTLQNKLIDWGVNQDTQIVVYDDVSGVIAGRFWWVLQWMGHSQVAVLDGGFDCWQNARYPLESTTPIVSKPGNFKRACADALWVTSDQLEQSLGQADTKVIDARATERYSGEKETVDGEGGHIPTSLNYPLSENLGADGKFLSSEQLRTRFKDIAHQTTIHSCGSGVTACHNILAMNIAGFDKTKLYVGSWSEWIRSPKRKRVQGKEPGNI